MEVKVRQLCDLLKEDCAVGLLFALLPVLGGHGGIFQGIKFVGKLLLVLSMFLTAASFLAWSFVPRFLKLMIQLSSQEAKELWEKIQERQGLNKWGPEIEEEYEDKEGNIYNKKTSTDIQRQGLI